PPATEIYTLSLHDALPIYVLVGLEKQDLVLRMGLVDRLEPLGQLVVGDLLRPGPQVEPELAVLVDSELDLALPFRAILGVRGARSEEHTSELQSLAYLVCR